MHLDRAARSFVIFPGAFLDVAELLPHLATARTSSFPLPQAAQRSLAPLLAALEPRGIRRRAAFFPTCAVRLDSGTDVPGVVSLTCL